MSFAQIVALAPWGAITFVLAACLQAGYTFFLLRKTGRTMGKIIDIEKTPRRTIATVDYVTHKGKHCRMVIPMRFDDQDRRKGNILALRYELKRPTRVVVERHIQIGWGRAGALFGLGILLLMVGLVFG